MNMTPNFRSVEKTDGYVLKEANVIIERRRMIMKVLSSALFSLVIRIQCGSIPAQSIAMCSSYRSLAAVLTRVVEIFRQLMRSLYRGISAYLDSLWRLLYLANAVIHVCFSKVGRLRDSDHSTFDRQARLARDAWSMVSRPFPLARILGPPPSAITKIRRARKGNEERVIALLPGRGDCFMDNLLQRG